MQGSEASQKSRRVREGQPDPVRDPEIDSGLWVYVSATVLKEDPGTDGNCIEPGESTVRDTEAIWAGG